MQTMELQSAWVFVPTGMQVAHDRYLKGWQKQVCNNSGATFSTKTQSAGVMDRNLQGTWIIVLIGTQWPASPCLCRRNEIFWVRGIHFGLPYIIIPFLYPSNPAVAALVIPYFYAHVSCRMGPLLVYTVGLLHDHWLVARLMNLSFNNCGKKLTGMFFSSTRVDVFYLSSTQYR